MRVPLTYSIEVVQRCVGAVLTGVRKTASDRRIAARASLRFDASAQ